MSTPQDMILTPEQIEKISEHNSLLKEFSAMLENIQEQNPGTELPTTLMFACFIAGAGAAGKNVAPIMYEALHTMRQEMLEMKKLMATYHHQMEEEGSEVPKV